MDIGPDTYEVYLYLADERGGCSYAIEHRFPERPDVETVRCLLEEARDHFRVLYDEFPSPEDVTVAVTCVDDGC